MNSLFDVPAQLAMVLQLAVTAAATEPPAAPEIIAPAPITASLSEPLEGPFRFGENTWLHALHQDPQAAETIGARVFVTSGGRYYLPAPGDRPRVVAARSNDELAERVAYRAAVRNALVLRAVFKRSPTAGDLYVAHVFGAPAAIDLIHAVSDAPDAALSSRLPQLSEASIGTADAKVAGPTVAEFYKRISGALHEPPRLIAIGLAPREAARLREEVAGATEMAWQATVDVAKEEKTAQ